MKIIILTTETAHHTYFVKTLKESYDDISVFCETRKGIATAFETVHNFESQRENYEWKRWFNGEKLLISTFVPINTLSFISVNCLT